MSSTGLISSSWTSMPQLIEVASSGNGCWMLGYVNPIENLWDQLNRRAEGRNPAPQNLSDLRAILQEEWDAMPHDTCFSCGIPCQVIIKEVRTTTYSELVFILQPPGTAASDQCSFFPPFKIKAFLTLLFYNTTSPFL